MPDAICLACALPYRDEPTSELVEAVCRCPPPQHAAERIECPSCGGSLCVGARACPFCSCTLATARCVYCAAWNLGGSQFCRACGKDLAEASAAERAPLGACPRCGGGLQARLYADLDADECDDCGGIFLQQAVLDRLIRSREKSAPLLIVLPKRERYVEKKVQYLSCPMCQKLMNRQIFGRTSGVIVDTCKLHGVWFDAEELAAIIAFAEGGGLAESRAREREQADRDMAQRRKLAQQAWEQGSAWEPSTDQSLFLCALEALFR